MNRRQAMFIPIKAMNELEQLMIEIQRLLPSLSDSWELSSECYIHVLNELHRDMKNQTSLMHLTVFFEFFYTFNQALIESNPLRFEAGEGNIILIDHELDREIYYHEESDPPFYSTIKQEKAL